MTPDPIDPMHINVRPLSERPSDIRIEDVAIDPRGCPPEPGRLAEHLDALATRILAARERGASVMLAYGAHLIKNGAGSLVNALVEGGLVTHVATQGAGIIHDWEFALQGASSESVRDNAPVGRFGTWDETGRWINLAVIAGAAEGLGFGQAIGRFIAKEGLTLPTLDDLAEAIREDPKHPLAAARSDLLCAMDRFDLPAGWIDVPHPYKKYSVPALAYERGVPFTVHPGIGYDIITNHPMFHGGALGRAAGTDARIFAQSVLHLSGGVYLSVGSAIMSPQVFEKAVSIANNLLEQQGKEFLHDHHIAIVDIQDDGNWDWSQGEPPKDHPAYYLRFCKSFHRMGGTTQYLCGDNRLVLHNLLARLTPQE